MQWSLSLFLFFVLVWAETMEEENRREVGVNGFEEKGIGHR